MAMSNCLEQLQGDPKGQSTPAEAGISNGRVEETTDVIVLDAEPNVPIERGKTNVGIKEAEAGLTPNIEIIPKT